MSGGGFGRRGYGPRGFRLDGTARGFGGPRFPQPNFNQPRRGGRSTVDPWCQPLPPWQLNVCPYQNFVPRPPFRADTQYYLGHGGRGRAQKSRGVPGFPGARGRAAPMEHRFRGRQPQLEHPIILQGKPEPPRVPALGSEEERRQKITETADKLKQKLSQITAEDTMNFWDNDFDSLPTSEESAISNKGIPELRHDPSELNLTFHDFRDIGRVDTDSGTVMDDSVIILDEPLDKTKTDVADTRPSEREMEAGKDLVVDGKPLEAAEQPALPCLEQAPPECQPVLCADDYNPARSPSTNPQETVSQPEPPLSTPAYLLSFPTKQREEEQLQLDPTVEPSKVELAKEQRREPTIEFVSERLDMDKNKPAASPENKRMFQQLNRAGFPTGYSLGSQREIGAGYRPEQRPRFPFETRPNFEPGIRTGFQQEIKPGLQPRFDRRSQFTPRLSNQDCGLEHRLRGARSSQFSQQYFQRQHNIFTQQQSIEHPTSILQLKSDLRFGGPPDQNEVNVSPVLHSPGPSPGLCISPSESNPCHEPSFLLKHTPPPPIQYPPQYPPPPRPPPPPSVKGNVSQQPPTDFDRNGSYLEVSVALKEDKSHPRQACAPQGLPLRLGTQEEVLQLPSAYDPSLPPQQNSMTMAPLPVFDRGKPPSMITIGLTDPPPIRFAQIPPLHMTPSQPSGFIPGLSTSYIPNLNPLYDIQPVVQKCLNGMTMVPMQMHSVLPPPPLPTGALEIETPSSEHIPLNEFSSVQASTNPNMDDELEEMQEALEFAKQQINMTSGEKSLEFQMPTFPDSPVMAAVTPTGESNPPPCAQPAPSLVSKAHNFKEHKSKKTRRDINYGPQLLPDEQQIQHDDSNFNCGRESLLPEDLARPKVVFNVQSKMKVISKSDEWRKQAEEPALKSKTSKTHQMPHTISEENRPAQPTRVDRETMQKGRGSKVQLEETSVNGHDGRKKGKRDSERKRRERTAGDLCRSGERSPSMERHHLPTESKDHLTAGHRKERCQSQSSSPVTEGDLKQTEVQVEESRNLQSSIPKRYVPESSWKNKVIARFLKMSKNDICNMVNNSGLRKFDIAMKHLVREKKSSMSQQRRSSADEKVKGYDMSREEFMLQLNAMLDPSATVDVANLPTEFIHHLSEVLQLDLDSSQTETAVPILAVKTEVNLCDAADLNSMQDLCSKEMNYDKRLDDGKAQDLDKLSDSGLAVNNFSRDRSMRKMNNELDTSWKVQPNHDSNVSDSHSDYKMDIGILRLDTGIVKEPTIRNNNSLNELQGGCRVECSEQTTLSKMATLDDIFTSGIAKAKLGRKSAQLFPISVTETKLHKASKPNTTAQKTVVDLDEMFSAGIDKVKLVSLNTEEPKVVNKIFADRRSSSDERYNLRLEKTERWNRKKREDPDMFRNLTKEEWESKYGRPMDRLMEKEYRAHRSESSNRDYVCSSTIMKSADTLQCTRASRNNRRSRNCLSPIATRNRSPSVCLPRLDEIDMEHLKEQYKESEEDGELEQSCSISDTCSSRSSSSCSSSSGCTTTSSNSNVAPPDVTKLLKVIKEQEKIAKKRSLNETIRDEIAAEIERAKRKERDRQRERKGQSKEKEKKKRGKKWRNVRMKRDRKKKKRKKRKRRRNANSSGSENPNEEIPEKLLTEMEIKKEVEIKDEPGLEMEQGTQSISTERARNVASSSTEQAVQKQTAFVQQPSQATTAVKTSIPLVLTAPSQQRGTSSSQPSSERQSTTMSSQQTEAKVKPASDASSVQQLKTKAQLKEMPQTSGSKGQGRLQNLIESTAPPSPTVTQAAEPEPAAKQMVEACKTKRPAPLSQARKENADAFSRTKEDTAASVKKEAELAPLSQAPKENADAFSRTRDDAAVFVKKGTEQPAPISQARKESANAFPRMKNDAAASDKKEAEPVPLSQARKESADALPRTSDDAAASVMKEAGPAPLSQARKESADTFSRTKDDTAASVKKEEGYTALQEITQPSENNTALFVSQLSKSGVKKIDIGAYKARALKKRKEIESNPVLLTENLLSIPCLAKKRSEEAEPRADTKLNLQQDRLDDQSQQKNNKDPRLRKRSDREKTSASNGPKSDAQSKSDERVKDPTGKYSCLYMDELATSKREDEQNKQKGKLQRTTVEQPLQPSDPNKSGIKLDKSKRIPADVVTQSLYSESESSNDRVRSTFPKVVPRKERGKSRSADGDRTRPVKPKRVHVGKSKPSVDQSEPTCTADGHSEVISEVKVKRKKEQAPFSSVMVNVKVVKSKCRTDIYPEKLNLLDQKESTMELETQLIPKRLKRTEEAAEGPTIGDQIRYVRKEEQKAQTLKVLVDSEKDSAVLVEQPEHKRDKLGNSGKIAGSTQKVSIKLEHQEKNTIDEIRNAGTTSSKPLTKKVPPEDLQADLYVRSSLHNSRKINELNKTKDSKQPSETLTNQLNEAGIQSQESLAVNETVNIVECSQLETNNSLQPFKTEVTRDEKLLAASVAKVFSVQLDLRRNLVLNGGVSNEKHPYVLIVKGSEKTSVPKETNESLPGVDEDLVEQLIDSKKTVEDSIPDRGNRRNVEMEKALKVLDSQRLFDEPNRNHCVDVPTKFSDEIPKFILKEQSTNSIVEITDECKEERPINEQRMPMVKGDTVISILESHKSSFKNVLYEGETQCSLPVKGQYEEQREFSREETSVDDKTMIEDIALCFKEVPTNDIEVIEFRHTVEDLPSLLLASSDSYSQADTDGNADQNEITVSNREVLNDVSNLETCQPATTSPQRVATKAQRKILPEMITSTVPTSRHDNISAKNFTERCHLGNPKLMHSDAVEACGSVTSTVLRDFDAPSNVETDDENLENIDRFVNEQTQNTMTASQTAVGSTLESTEKFFKSNKATMINREVEWNSIEHDPENIGNELLVVNAEERHAKYIENHDFGGTRDTRKENVIVGEMDDRPVEGNTQPGGETESQQVTGAANNREDKENFENRNEKASNIEIESAIKSEARSDKIGETETDNREIKTSITVSNEEAHAIQDNISDPEECDFAGFENTDFIVLSEISSEEDFSTVGDDRPKTKKRTRIGMIKRTETLTNNQLLQPALEEAMKSVSESKSDFSLETSSFFPSIPFISVKTECVSASQLLPMSPKDSLEYSEASSAEAMLSDIAQQDKSLQISQEHMITSQSVAPQTSQADRTTSNGSEQSTILGKNTPISQPALALSEGVYGVTQISQIAAVTSNIIQGITITGAVLPTSQATPAMRQEMLKMTRTSFEVPTVSNTYEVTECSLVSPLNASASLSLIGKDSKVLSKISCTVGSREESLDNSDTSALTKLASRATDSIELTLEDRAKRVSADGNRTVEMKQVPEGLIPMDGTYVEYTARNNTTFDVSPNTASRDVELSGKHKFLCDDLEFEKKDDDSFCGPKQEEKSKVEVPEKVDDVEADLEQMGAAVLKDLNVSSNEKLSNVKRNNEGDTEVENIINMLQGKDTSYCMPIYSNIPHNNASVIDNHDADGIKVPLQDDVKNINATKGARMFHEDVSVYDAREDFTTTTASYITGQKIPFVELQKMEGVDALMRAAKLIPSDKSNTVKVLDTLSERKPLNLNNEGNRDEHLHKIKRRMKHKRHKLPKKKINNVFKDKNLVTVVEKPHTKEAAMARMIAIDLEIHKLMSEKMSLYELLERDTSHTEDDLASSKEKSKSPDRKIEEVGPVRPRTPAVLMSQLIQNFESETATSTQALRRSCDETCPTEVPERVMMEPPIPVKCKPEPKSLSSQKSHLKPKIIQSFISEDEEQVIIAMETRNTPSCKRKVKKKKVRKEKADRTIRWESKEAKAEPASSARETSADRLRDVKSILKKKTRENGAGREKIGDKINAREEEAKESYSSGSRENAYSDTKGKLRSHTKKEIELEKSKEKPHSSFGKIIESISNDSAVRPRIKNYKKVEVASSSNAAIEGLRNKPEKQRKAHSRELKEVTRKKVKKIKLPAKTENVTMRTAVIATQDRAQIYSDESTQESVPFEPKKPTKGLVLLEESFEREMACSKILKVKDHKKKRRKLDNLFEPCNSQMTADKVVPRNSQDITNLQQKRDMFGTVETKAKKTEYTEKIYEHMMAVINAVAENRIEQYNVISDSRSKKTEKEGTRIDGSQERIPTKVRELLNEEPIDSKDIDGIEQDSNGLVEQINLVAGLPRLGQDIPGSALMKSPEDILSVKMKTDLHQPHTLQILTNEIRENDEENSSNRHRDELLSNHPMLSSFDDVEDLIGNLPDDDEFSQQEGPLDEMDELCNDKDIIGTTLHVSTSRSEGTMPALLFDDIHRQYLSDRIPIEKVLEISPEFEEVDLDCGFANGEKIQEIVIAKETKFSDNAEELNPGCMIEDISQDSLVLSDRTREDEKGKNDKQENHVSNCIEKVHESSGSKEPNECSAPNLKMVENDRDTPSSMLKEVNTHTVTHKDIPSAQALQADNEPIGANSKNNAVLEQMERILQDNIALSTKVRKSGGREPAPIPLRRSTRQSGEKNQQKQNRVVSRKNVSRKRLRSSSSPTPNTSRSPSENTEDSGYAKKRRTEKKQFAEPSIIAKRRSTLRDSEASSINPTPVDDADETDLVSHALKKDLQWRMGKRKSMNISRMMSCKVKLVDIKNTYLKPNLHPNILQRHGVSVINFQAEAIRGEGAMPNVLVAQKITEPHALAPERLGGEERIASAEGVFVEEPYAAVQSIGSSKTLKTIPDCQRLMRTVSSGSAEELIKENTASDSETEKQGTIHSKKVRKDRKSEELEDACYFRSTDTSKVHGSITLESSGRQKCRDPQSTTVAQNAQQNIVEIPEADTREISPSEQRPCPRPSEMVMDPEPFPGDTEDRSQDLLEIQIVEMRKLAPVTSSRGEDVQAGCMLSGHDADMDVKAVEQPRKHYTSHKGPILDIKVFEDSFVAASEDGMIYRYCIETGTLVNIYEGHKAAVTCIYALKIASSDTTREWLFSGSLDGSLRCYNIKTGLQVRDTADVGSPVQCMDQSWGVIFLGTKSGHVTRYNIKSDAIKEERIKFSEESVLALKATTEGPRRVLIVASRCQPITIRDAQNGLFLRTVSGEKSHTVYSLMMDSCLVYCGTSSTTIPVFDFINGIQITQYNAGVGIVCMRMYRKLLFAGCYDGNIYVFDTEDHKLVCSIPGPGNMLLSMEIVKSQIIAGSKDKRLQMWQMPAQVQAVLNRRT